MLEEYVSRIVQACGEGGDFVVILKFAKREEAMKRIFKKFTIERTLSGILITGRYKDKEISVFRTGKLILKGLKERKEVEKTLEELFA